MRRPSTAERIVTVFEKLVTEAHRGSIEHTLEITDVEFDACIARARALGVKKGLRITPVYDRDGWWTCEPTRRIAAIAVHETLKRQRGEALRHARVYADFGELDGFTKWHTAAATGTLDAFIEGLRDLSVSSDVDYVLERIDGSDHDYVVREAQAA